MARAPQGSAAEFLPARKTLGTLAGAAKDCRGCGLYRDATQTVFGEGLPGAEVVLVGEQPGDHEDREGRPFVGPAGRLLDAALEEAGLDRADVYLTNVVKHFKFEQRGKRVHPSSILRAPDDSRAAERALFVRDLAMVAAELDRRRRSA
jgi:uracil-DNA glycosylase